MERQRSDEMTQVRRADPAARQRAVLFVVLGALAGVSLLAGVDRYWIMLRDWLLSDPAKFDLRLKVVFVVFGALVSGPLIGFSVYLCLLGDKVLRAQHFPPPGYRVIRDTPILSGQAAMSRGRGLKVLALCLSVIAALLWLLLWRLAWML